MSVMESSPAIHVPKAWGHEVWLVNTELYCLKELHIAAGWQCSLHRHRIKDETFLVQSGVVEIELGSRRWIAHTGESIHVPPGTWHRFGSINAAVLLEVSTHHSDEDVERREESRRLSESSIPTPGCQSLATLDDRKPIRI